MPRDKCSRITEEGSAKPEILREGLGSLLGEVGRQFTAEALRGGR